MTNFKKSKGLVYIIQDSSYLQGRGKESESEVTQSYPTP